MALFKKGKKPTKKKRKAEGYPQGEYNDMMVPRDEQMMQDMPVVREDQQEEELAGHEDSHQ